MATIQINVLNSTGSDLFSDSESYLQELSESDLSTQGGIYSFTDLFSTLLTRGYWTV